MTHIRSAPHASRHLSRYVVAGLLAVVAAIAALGQSPTSLIPNGGSPFDDMLVTYRQAHRGGVPAGVWPQQGQAAFIRTGQAWIHAGPNQRPAPIASIAKVMTAYLVLRDHPLRPGDDGPAITITEADVQDTYRRAGRHESVVPVAAGEQLSEREAL